LHSGTNLPINSGLILLLVAGIIIGVAAVKRKTATIGKA
jgi:F0F1-type ATP synthase assembly protein I